MLSVPMNKEMKEKSVQVQTKAYGMLSKKKKNNLQTTQKMQ